MPYYPPTAPSSATYITQTSDPVLSAEQALNSLSSGYMKVTTGTGVVSSQVAPIPVSDGGTGATTTAGAQAALGVAGQEVYMFQTFS